MSSLSSQPTVSEIAHSGWFLDCFRSECSCTQSSSSTRPLESTLTLLSVSRAYVPTRQRRRDIRLAHNGFRSTHRVVIGITSLLERRDDLCLVERTSIIDVDLPMAESAANELRQRRRLVSLRHHIYPSIHV
jgi:hypothetical protein